LFSPYFFRSSFSALMRSASHGWDGRSNFARENFGSPNDSLLLLRRRLLLFLLFFFLGGGFLRLLGLRGLEGGLLRHPDRQARAAVRPGALPADLLAGLVAHAFVRPDHLHQIDVVPQPDFDLRTDQVQVEPRLPILRPVHHPGREQLAELAQGRLDLVRLFLRQIAEAFRARHAGQVGDGLGHANPDARDRCEGVPDRARPVEVRVRHPDDVAEVFFHALEFLRRPRGLRLLLLLGLLLGGPRRLLGRRGGRRALGFGFRLLVRHRVPWERGAPNSERYLRVKERRAGLPPPAPLRPDGQAQSPPHAHTLQGGLRSEGAPLRTADIPVAVVGGLVVQKRDDVSLQVPAALIAREEETLRPGWFVAAPEDRPTRRANLPETGRLAVAERLLHRKRMVLETECAVEPPRVPVLQTGRHDDSLGP